MPTNTLTESSSLRYIWSLLRVCPSHNRRRTQANCSLVCVHPPLHRDCFLSGNPTQLPLQGNAQIVHLVPCGSGRPLDHCSLLKSSGASSHAFRHDAAFDHPCSLRCVSAYPMNHAFTSGCGSTFLRFGGRAVTSSRQGPPSLQRFG